MTEPDYTAVEREVQEAFPLGRFVDLADRPQRSVRAGVLRDLLLNVEGGGAGASAALRLAHARIIGRLDLAHSVIGCPIRLRNCEFDEQVDLYGARTRELSFTGSHFRGIIASGAVIDGRLRLMDSRSEQQIRLVGARILGALILSGASFEDADVAFDGSRLYVANDIVAEPLGELGTGRAFSCRGEMRLKNAVVDGSVLLEGAQLVSRTGTALSAFDLTVAAVLNCCEGFTARGTVSLAYAEVGSRVCFEGAHLDGAGGPGVPPGPGGAGGSTAGGVALNAHHLTTRELSLLPEAAPRGAVDLTHASIGLLRDEAATWAEEVRLDGLRYDSLSAFHDVPGRLRWLRLDPEGYRPRVYEQLAATYRTHGRDSDARTVLLAKQRHRRESLGPAARAWSHLQDALVGYGYRPIRAAAWIALLVLAGSLLFDAHPPRSVDGTAASAFHAPMYTLDLLLPLVDLGQEQHFTPSGATIWFAYFLIAAGWTLATTVATGITRNLRGG